MALTNTKYQRWSRVRGWNQTIPPQELPPDLSPSMMDVELMHGAIGRRRPKFSEFSLTSGPSSSISVLARFRTTAGVSELWAFSGNTDAHRASPFAWSSVTLTDTPANFSISNFVHTAAHNGKFFLAYNSAANRLHLWDGSAVRRVGVGKPAALTVADTGAGAYAATARYYRTSQRIKSGSDIIAESELSDAVSFTPSGAGTAARITKSATVDSATHWVVWGLIGTSGDTYDLYEELAEIAVGTTTYDDSADPASYDGDAPAPLGMHIPPPSCKLLLSDGNRLLMAGAYESSGAAGETTPKSSRVWFTRVLGSSDIGDDETIPNTTTQKNWIDIGENDGDSITALAGPLGGVIYVFKRYSIWRLIPTGNDTAPYRAERLTTAAGSGNALSSGTVNERAAQYSVVMAEDQVGRPALFFWHFGRCYQISIDGVIEYVSEDLSDFAPSAGVYSKTYGMVLWATGLSSATQGRLYGFKPSLASRGDDGAVRGGWMRWSPSMNSSNATTFFAASYITTASDPDQVVFGGVYSTTATIGYPSTRQSNSDDGGGVFTPEVTSKSFLLGGGVLNVSCDEPTIEVRKSDGSSATASVSYIADYGAQTLSATSPTLTNGSATSVAKRVEGLFLADARAVQIKHVWGSAQWGLNESLDALTIPYRVQEPA